MVSKRLAIFVVVAFGVAAVGGWWVWLEALNVAVERRHGTAFLPLHERREDGTPVSFRPGPGGGPRNAMAEVVGLGCLAIPLAGVLAMTSFVLAVKPCRWEWTASGSGRRWGRLGWGFACGLMVLVCVRIWMLSAWEAARAIYD